jgi:hypothetical protein
MNCCEMGEIVLSTRLRGSGNHTLLTKFGFFLGYWDKHKTLGHRNNNTENLGHRGKKPKIDVVYLCIYFGN